MSRASKNRSKGGGARGLDDSQGLSGADDSQNLEYARAIEDICVHAFALATRARCLGLTRVSLMLESAALEAACDMTISGWPTDA